jgi:putative aldouronate transport system permease protein
MNAVGTHRKNLSVFTFFNYFLLITMSLLCVLPFFNLIALSFSGSYAVASGKVALLPVDFTLSSYQFVVRSGAFMTAFLISIERVVVGVSINMLLTILVAYPLSKEKHQFRSRGIYAWYFILTSLMSVGLIPLYMTVKFTGLMDQFLALILPTAVPVFNVIVLLNFFRNLPKELEESANIDGANEWTILWRIFIPLSKPALATLTLYCIIHHWNSWFDGIILMNNPAKYPLQSYLRTVIINPETYFKMAAKGSDYNKFLAFVNFRTTKAAQIFIAAAPMLCVYPFLQKYFTKGLVLGSVKG